MKCPICNGDMLGDGVTSPMHCEFVEVDPWVEPDAPTTFCDPITVLDPKEAVRDLINSGVIRL